jgi:K+/H+ antiporter YhaU regulatory subunit KhtT
MRRSYDIDNRWGKTNVGNLNGYKTGCHVIATQTDGVMHINPDPSTPLQAQGEIILIGTVEAERQFLHQYT